MDFKFQSTKTDLTINGVECTIDVGDARMQDRLIEAAGIVQSAELPAEGANVAASESLRRVVRAILGDEATDAIYQGEEPNLYKDVQLILFLRKVLDESEPTKRFESDMLALDSIIGADE